jgi:hypothetical protein
MYRALNAVLDSPLVRRNDSVNAQKPIDCPGSADTITAQDRTKMRQFLTLLAVKISTPRTIRYKNI